MRETALMDRGRIFSLKQRIAASQSVTLTGLAEEVTKLGPPPPDELVTAIARRLEQGQEPATGAIAALVAVSGSRRLYEAARERLGKDTDSLIRLLRADIPDAVIENRLRDELYQAFRDSGNPWRGGILRALADHGSTDCLEVLEAIAYDLKPKLQAIKLAREVEGAPVRISPSDGLEALAQAVTRDADMEFRDAVQAALERVQARGKAQANEWGAGAQAEHPFARARWYIEQAEQQVAGQFHDAALNYCRKALEAALKSVIRELRLKLKGDGPLEKLQLPPLIATVNSQLDLPKEIRTDINAVRDDSTYGSHDQGVTPEQDLTAAIAQAAIDKYRRIEAHLCGLFP